MKEIKSYLSQGKNKKKKNKKIDPFLAFRRKEKIIDMPEGKSMSIIQIVLKGFLEPTRRHSRALNLDSYVAL